MELKEYIAQFNSDVQTDADSFQISTEEAFLINIADKLVESEVIRDYKSGYFRNKGLQGRTIEFYGYSYEEADGTINIFEVDDLEESELNLTTTNIDKIVGRAEELINSAIDYRFLDWEESSIGYEAASEIYRLFQNRENPELDVDLKRIHVFILSNKVLSQRYKNIKRKPIRGIPVDYSIYDATKLFEMARSGFEKEPVNICLNDYGVAGIDAIKATVKEGEFESYLAIIPGRALADIYLENGTQVLEGNVRAFLSVRGKVNKGIRKTILENPEKFFILNNGITVTSDNIVAEQSNNGIFIKKIDNMQIVNGGQTTASLANATIKDKADLSKVQVMMKLSVLASHEVSEKLVPEISRASNSQNKVNEADFFSNHPYHVKIQELSERNLAPAVDGNQYQTEWFYERARGQYTVAQMKLTAAQTRSWQLKHPKNQVIRKTDLAKFMMTYDGYPQDVSKGAQAVMKKFSLIIQGPNGDDGIWTKNPSAINASYFKNAIAKAIIFKETEKLVSSLDWYKEVKAYRANIVSYTIAVLAEYARNQKKEFDLKKIWNKQHNYPALINQCKITSREVYDFLTREDRITQNVTEWAKKEACWKQAKKEEWSISPNFNNTLVDIIKPKKTEVTESTVDSMEFVLSKDASVWQDLADWGKKFLYLTPKDEGILKLALQIKTQGRIPTDRQFSNIVKIYNYLVQKGFKEK
ncbi:AIPR family protein [Enterococcus hirae]|nr:AIPR family protein [Enterococcus hirae]